MKSFKVIVMRDSSDNIYKVYRSNWFLRMLGLAWISCDAFSPIDALVKAQKRLYGRKLPMGKYEITEDGYKEVHEKI